MAGRDHARRLLVVAVALAALALLLLLLTPWLLDVGPAPRATAPLAKVADTPVPARLEPGLPPVHVSAPGSDDRPAASGTDQAPDAPDSPEALVELTGRVLADDPGAVPDAEGRIDLPPFAGATVVLVEDAVSRDGPRLSPQVPVVTGRDGRFRFVVPRALVDQAMLTIRASAPGRITAAISFSRWGRRPLGDGEKLLVLQGGGLTLEGRAVDASGAPVPGAEVLASRTLSPELEATTGSDGRFVIEGLAPSRPGSPFTEVTLGARAGEACATLYRVVVGPGQPPVELVLTPQETMRVRVEGGPPLRLTGSLWSGTGDERRCFASESAELALDCWAGDWLDLVATAPGYQPKRVAVRAPCAPVVVRLAPLAGRIAGRVVDARGEPVDGVTVVGQWGDGPAPAVYPPPQPTRAGLEERPLERLRLMTRSRSDGEFVLDGFPPSGKVELQTSRREHGAVDASDRPLGCEPSSVTLGGGPLLLRLVDPWSCSARLRLVAAETGEPLLEARADGAADMRDLGGAVFEADLLGPGRRTVDVRAEGRRTRRLEVDVGPGQQLDLGDVPLARAGEVEVAVRWPAAPIRDLRLRWTDSTGAVEERDEGVDETLLLDDLLPGRTTFTLTARRPDGRRQEATFVVDVVADRTTRAEVDLRGAALLPPAPWLPLPLRAR